MGVPFLLVVLLAPWSMTEPAIELRQVVMGAFECEFKARGYEGQVRGRAAFKATCTPWNGAWRTPVGGFYTGLK